MNIYTWPALKFKQEEADIKPKELGLGYEVLEQLQKVLSTVLGYMLLNGQVSQLWDM